MKIWKHFSADHSARLRIIGTFKEVADAEKAAALINDLIGVVNSTDDEAESLYLTDALIAVTKKYDLGTLGKYDLEGLRLDHSINTEAKQIEISTDETEIAALIKAMISQGASIELFSLHDYPEN